MLTIVFHYFFLLKAIVVKWFKFPFFPLKLSTKDSQIAQTTNKHTHKQTTANLFSSFVYNSSAHREDCSRCCEMKSLFLLHEMII
jgi:hypothetical protein